VAAATAALHEKVLLLESSEKLLRSSLSDKDILLKEIHHRVKNNLQVISSLIQLQSYALHDERDLELLQETQQRIRAMAQLHELLYRSRDLGSIDAAEYLGSLAHELALSSGRTEPELRAESCRLALDEAVPLGLIANELVQNALKHAYPKGQDGYISIEFSRDGKGYALVVSDRGAGLPAGFDPLAARSMGLTLVRSLSEQLGGILAFDGPPGFSARLRFPSRTAT
jgi:two-component sensor histidine kinase